MNALREDIVHYAVRQHLKKAKWQLIAGQYPNGSDNELYALNIVDPTLARDNSPDHRRHSQNKFVPDLVAFHDGTLLIIEMKPRYSASDEVKLELLLGDRLEDFYRALDEFCVKRKMNLSRPIREMILVPSLGFTFGSTFRSNPTFCYFFAKSVSEVEFQGNTSLSYL